jgi:hypothetical protein
MGLLSLLLCALATYRVAYLIAVEDGPADLLRRLRAAAERRYPPVLVEPGVLEDSNVVRGLTCPLCVSFWAALPVYALSWLAPPVVWWLGIAGAVLIIHRWLEGR